MNFSVISYKPRHDGALVWLKNGKLEFSVEGEKDSNARYSGIESVYHTVGSLLSQVDTPPDVLAWGGGSPPRHSEDVYFGTSNEAITVRELNILGKKMPVFRSTHERAHIFCSYGLSPFPQGQPVYVLVWEGSIGKFYEIDGKLNIRDFDTVLPDVGIRYAMGYGIADYKNRRNSRHGFLDGNEAGKVMALASYGEVMDPAKRKDWSAVVQRMLDMEMVWGEWSNPDDVVTHPAYKKKIESFIASEIENSKLFNIGVESEDFKDFTLALSDEIFDRYYQYAKKNLTKGYPLLISGGCGLNCDWNSRWKDCGLFADVFVPPCTNDSGIAIGMAVDAQRHFTGNAKVEWSVYCGEEFVMDEADMKNIQVLDFSFDKVAALLAEDKVLAWVDGKYEIGPRALCHRSLIAAPFTKETHRRLNKIKKREGFRPIAPVCLEEDVSEYFDWKGPSPYMLFFQRVKTDRLQAVTHVNNTARAQTVNDQNNPRMAELLRAFKKRTGFSVLCNTSLNFKGKGFINRMSDLVRYTKEDGLDGFVVGEKIYLRKSFDYKKTASSGEVPASRAYMDLEKGNLNLDDWVWLEEGKGGKTTAKIDGKELVFQFGEEVKEFYADLSPNVGPFVAPRIVDMAGYHFLQFEALLPRDTIFTVSMTESGAGPVSNPSFSGANGADGESYGFPELIGRGEWKTYRVNLSQLELNTSWGNQEGNRILDLQGLAGIGFYVLTDNKDGEMRLRELAFTV